MWLIFPLAGSLYLVKQHRGYPILSNNIEVASPDRHPGADMTREYYPVIPVKLMGMNLKCGQINPCILAPIIVIPYSLLYRALSCVVIPAYNTDYTVLIVDR